MFNEIKEQIINFIMSRIFVLMLIIFLLFGVLVHRLFVLQIVKGEDYQNNFTLKILKEQSIKSTRGKIFDVNGKLLAYDELAYSVTIEDNYDSTGSEKNRQMNENIYRLIHMVEDNGDDLACTFNVVLDESGHYAYSVEGKSLLRFLADIYGHSKTEDLKLKERDATPQELITYLCSSSKFGIGKYVPNEKGKYDFIPMEGYTKDELLKMVAVRYAMSLNSYQKYIATNVATGVSEKTVAMVMENKSEMQGVDIAEDTVRRYIDEPSLSPILGYTGIISQAELEEYNASGGKYERNDMVGRAGIEQVMEKQLQGQKGRREIYVDNVGKVAEVASVTQPVAGNDLYLTIDADLQEAIYRILEQKLAGIIVSRIKNVKEYVQGENESASNIIIPIDSVYYALLNNGILDLSVMGEEDAGMYEQQIHAACEKKQDQVLATLREELLNGNNAYDTLDKEYQVYESFITQTLSSSNEGILISDKVDEQDEIYQAWKNETISLPEYLKHAIAMEWIEVTRLDAPEQYSDSAQVYEALTDKIIELLEDNNAFQRKVIKYMIRDGEISPLQICMALFEQGVIRDDLETKRLLLAGELSPYDFMVEEIRTIEITPAMLALDPCTASCVVCDSATGEVRACVSYPSYDNNRLANFIDTEYYNRLRNDLSNPLYSYATQQKTAPGSTYKIVSAMAGIYENVITTGEQIECLGEYDKVDNPKCWKYPGKHGEQTLSTAITNSCNFYFYEVGYRLGLDGTGKYNSDVGLKKLAEYADKFGFTDTSGIELSETTPSISDEDSVRSAIGQGTNSFTTVSIARYANTISNKGTCYNISLLDKVTDPDGHIVEDYTPQVRNRVEASEDVWRSVFAGMRGVVNEAAAFKDSGVDAAGKTGTAQQVRTRPNHALFIGFAPSNDPKISLAVRIAYGYTSANAAEVARDVFQYYFGIKDKDSIVNGRATIPTSGTISD